MKLLVSAIVLVLCSAALSQETNSTTEPPTTQTTSSTVTPSTSEVPTTEVPSTTREVTTKVPPVTTTPEAPTTEAPTTETPTTEPKTTPSPPVSTTEVPKPDTCKFNVTHENGTCIRAEMKAEFVVSSKDKPILLDCESKLDQSDCSSNETQTLVVVKEGLYVLTMIFEKEKDTVSVRNISFLYTLPGVQEVVANNSGNLIKMKAGNSYLCKSEIDIPLENVTMKIMEIQVQAFAEKADNFGTAEECEADDKVSDIVPIAVGVALGALIIIVLIAYLVGRRRSRQKGYQSV